MNNNNKKITKKDMYLMIKKECKDNADIINFCDKELSLLDKKNKYVSPKDLQRKKLMK